VLVAFDFDGTLAPIVDNPDQARMRPATRTLLNRLTNLYPCVVISGRSRADVRRRLRGSGVRYVVGNHGAELGNAGQFEENIARWKAVLATRLAGLPGVWVEDKGLTLAIHYRQSPRRIRARIQVLKAARALGRARLIPAKQALNVVPEAAPHKGMALEIQRTMLQCDAALYVGDDATDEDVFSLEPPEKLLGVRVGARRTSRARFSLHNQSEIDDLLKVLAELREHNVKT
jgi:trehalose 6-phosphate phosphatase